VGAADDVAASDRSRGRLPHSPSLLIGQLVKCLAVEYPHIRSVKSVGEGGIFLHLVIMARPGAMGGRPSAVRAQQKAMPVIGYLGYASPGPKAEGSS
jgi:hypothetical protein